MPDIISCKTIPNPRYYATTENECKYYGNSNYDRNEKVTENEYESKKGRNVANVKNPKTFCKVIPKKYNEVKNSYGHSCSPETEEQLHFAAESTIKKKKITDEIKKSNYQNHDTYTTINDDRILLVRKNKPTGKILKEISYSNVNGKGDKRSPDIKGIKYTFKNKEKGTIITKEYGNTEENFSKKIKFKYPKTTIIFPDKCKKRKKIKYGHKTIVRSKNTVTYQNSEIHNNEFKEENKFSEKNQEQLNSLDKYIEKLYTSYPYYKFSQMYRDRENSNYEDKDTYTIIDAEKVVKKSKKNNSVLQTIIPESSNNSISFYNSIPYNKNKEDEKYLRVTKTIDKKYPNISTTEIIYQTNYNKTERKVKIKKHKNLKYIYYYIKPKSLQEEKANDEFAGNYNGNKNPGISISTDTRSDSNGLHYTIKNGEDNRGPGMSNTRIETYYPYKSNDCIKYKKIIIRRYNKYDYPNPGPKETERSYYISQIPIPSDGKIPDDYKVIYHKTTEKIFNNWYNEKCETNANKTANTNANRNLTN